MATVTAGIGIQPIVIEQTSVARYTALSETADGFTPDEGDRHFEPIGFPGVTQVVAVNYYRTRHTGLPTFSVRLNRATLTEYTFTDNGKIPGVAESRSPAQDATWVGVDRASFSSSPIRKCSAVRQTGIGGNLNESSARASDRHPVRRARICFAQRGAANARLARPNLKRGRHVTIVRHQTSGFEAVARAPDR